jgi:hypothetical protein
VAGALPRWGGCFVKGDVRERRSAEGRPAVPADRGTSSDGPTGFATFIVRILKDDRGRLSGVVEWVRTGKKVRFHDIAAISQVIAQMMESGPKDETP